jgi:hypothetical protein
MNEIALSWGISPVFLFEICVPVGAFKSFLNAG